jgi:hypothetical protein
MSRIWPYQVCEGTVAATGGRTAPLAYVDAHGQPPDWRPILIAMKAMLFMGQDTNRGARSASEIRVT